MLKKLAVIFTVLTIVSMLLVPIAYAADAQNFKSIDITENKTWYIGETLNNVPLKAYGVNEDGKKVDISDDVTFSIDDGDDTAFYFADNKLNSTGELGKAVIRADYKTASNTTLSAKLILTMQNAKTAAGETIGADALVEGAATYKTTGDIGTPDGGHYDGSAFSNFVDNWHCRLIRMSYASITKDAEGKITNVAPITEIKHRWWDSGYRSMGAWFYDDGVKGNPNGFDTIKLTDSALFHQNSSFEEDYGYGEFAEKWKGKKGYKSVDGTFRANASNDTEYIAERQFGDFDQTTGPWGFRNIKRTKGWHQLVVSLEKNPNAEYGWSVYTYFDGEKVAEKTVIPTEDPYNGAPADSTGWATMEIRPNYIGGAAHQCYMDDMILMGSIQNTAKVKITGEIGDNGSVTVNGEALANGGVAKVEPESNVTIKVTPADGYKVSKAKLGNTDLTLGEDGTATVAAPAADATLTVAFAKKTAADAVLTSISLTKNKNYYINESATDVPLNVVGYYDDGTEGDITEGVTFTSSDSKVFKVEGGKVSSTAIDGKAIITATVGGKTANLLMVHSTFAATNPDLAKFEVTGDPGTATGGHYDGASSDTLHSKISANWNVRLSLEGTDWFSNGYRTIGGWFYDDMNVSNQSYNRRGFATIHICDMIGTNSDFVSDWGYGAFADKWKDMKSVDIGGSMMTQATETASESTMQYQTNPTTFGIINGSWGFKPRTKGWHHVMYSIEKNPSAAYGWTMYFYMDGELFGIKDIVPTDVEKPANNSYFTLQGNSAYNKANAYPDGTSAYFDEIYATGSLEPVDTTKTLTGAIGEGGSVTVNGEAFANGASLKLEPDSDIAVKVTPNIGYDVDSVKLGDTALALNASNEVSVKMPVSDATLTVTFKAKSAAPSITTDASYNYFKTVDGKATAYVYGKLGDFYDPTAVMGYGMKLWVEDDPDHALTLAAMETNTTEAVAAPNTAFAIKVYGDAITADKAYIFKPYVGDTEGEEVKVTFTAE